ncbi:MAG: ATP-binding cassette domain-containing protein, partial [Thermodesulforhabdaceae bacterium]
MVNHAVSTVVRVIDFAKSYNKRRAVEKVSLEINRGEIFGLIGPDGAGKSTLMKAIAGVLSFDRGIVEVFGVTLDSEESAELVKHRIGFMPQGLGLNLYAELSVEENIDFFARLRGVKGRELEERKKKLLAMTRLDRFTDRAMKHLSGGMKQKLGLICTLIHQPELIILDEPTTGVDPVSRRDFWEILTELLYTQGITAIVSTAYLDEAERFHRLAFMFDGRVLASGDPAGLRRELPGNVFEIVTPDQIGAITRLRSRFSHVDNLGGYIRVLVDNESPGEPVTELLKGITITRVEETDPTLEDVFVALLRRDRQGASSIIGSGYPAETEKIPESAREDIRGFSSGEVVIEACELTRDFGSFRAVDRASFEVKRGEIFGLLGANGAGKTTLIKMLTGILPPTSGEGRIAGVDMRLAGKAIKERIGYMSQA